MGLQRVRHGLVTEQQHTVMFRLYSDVPTLEYLVIPQSLESSSSFPEQRHHDKCLYVFV